MRRIFGGEVIAGEKVKRRAVIDSGTVRREKVQWPWGILVSILTRNESVVDGSLWLSNCSCTKIVVNIGPKWRSCHARVTSSKRIHEASPSNISSISCSSGSSYGSFSIIQISWIRGEIQEKERKCRRIRDRALVHTLK